MFVYDFEVLKDETLVVSKRSIALPDVSAAWRNIANLAKGGFSPAEVDAMHAVWAKAVLLQAILWCRPYATKAISDSDVGRSGGKFYMTPKSADYTRGTIRKARDGRFTSSVDYAPRSSSPCGSNRRGSAHPCAPSPTTDDYRRSWG
jgi:hypothetical protein